jgi:hypothetical protein
MFKIYINFQMCTKIYYKIWKYCEYIARKLYKNYKHKASTHIRISVKEQL